MILWRDTEYFFTEKGFDYIIIDGVNYLKVYLYKEN